MEFSKSRKSQKVGLVVGMWRGRMLRILRSPGTFERCSRLLSNFGEKGSLFMVSIQVGSTILEPTAHGGISIYAQNTCPKSDQYSHLHINTQNLPKPPFRDDQITNSKILFFRKRERNSTDSSEFY